MYNITFSVDHSGMPNSAFFLKEYCFTKYAFKRHN